HYLGNVLRLTTGDGVLVFNGRNGEWRGVLAGAGTRRLTLALAERTRAQEGARDLHYLFAPLKHTRLDYMAQKAVEMGASRLQPVLTRHAQAARATHGRWPTKPTGPGNRGGITPPPEPPPPLTLEQAIAALEPERVLVFCDEAAPVNDPIAALAQARRGAQREPPA